MLWRCNDCLSLSQSCRWFHLYYWALEQTSSLLLAFSLSIRGRLKLQISPTSNCMHSLLFCSNKLFSSLVCYLEENHPFRNNCPDHWQLPAAARAVGVRRGAVLGRCTAGYLVGQQIILFFLKTNNGTSINTIYFLDRLVLWKYQARCPHRVTS